MIKVTLQTLHSFGEEKVQTRCGVVVVPDTGRAGKILLIGII